MPNPGHALRFIHPANHKKQPRPVLPSAHDMTILRRAAAGFIMVTLHDDGGATYSYEDGTPVSLRGRKHFYRLVKEGWLIPENESSLFGDQGLAQVYYTRKP